MIEFKPKQNRRHTAVFCSGMVILGFLIIVFASSKTWTNLIGAYAWAAQIAGILPVIIGLYFAEKYLFTSYIYQIDDEPDAISTYPKLYINCVQGKKAKPSSICLAFDSIISVEKCGRKDKYELPVSDFCADMGTKEALRIRYTNGTNDSAAVIDFDAGFASEITGRVGKFGYRAVYPEEDGSE